MQRYVLDGLIYKIQMNSLETVVTGELLCSQKCVVIMCSSFSKTP